MILGSTILIVFANIFAMHLYAIEHNEMGWKSYIWTGVLTLGTRAIEVELTPGCMVEVAKKLMIALQKSRPTMSQVERKNSTVKPSGPGALLRFIDFKVL